jgi:hypothetical protein
MDQGPDNERRNRCLAMGFSIDVAIDAAFGLLLDNLALGVGIGVALGIGLASRDGDGGGD